MVNLRHQNATITISCIAWHSPVEYFVRECKHDLYHTRSKFCHCSQYANWEGARLPLWRKRAVKVAQDDIAFKLAIFKKSLHLNDNTCFCSIIQASKLVLGLYWQKITFLSNFEQKILYPPGWPIVGVAYRGSGPSAAKMQLKRRIRHCPVACG